MEYNVQMTAQRISELRRIFGKSPEDMAVLLGISLSEYEKSEQGETDFTFSFLHKCAGIFGVDIKDLVTGDDPKLRQYTVTPAGTGESIDRRHGFTYHQLAADFREKLSEPFLVVAPYDSDNEDAEISLSTHLGNEFDFILSGSLKIQIGQNTEILSAGDSVYYDSSTPHGMIALGGEECRFIAVVIKHEDADTSPIPVPPAQEYAPFIRHDPTGNEIWHRYIDVEENEIGALESIRFHDTDTFNFAYDVVDAVAEREPQRRAMLHVEEDGTERLFTFRDISVLSNQCAHFFEEQGIRRGDRCMLVLKRHWQFWIAMMALHKIGAIAIPATNQLLEKDFVYRFNAANVSAIVCTADGKVAEEVERAAVSSPTLRTKIIAHGEREGWTFMDSALAAYPAEYNRVPQPSSDIMLMYFTSGTTGYPKIAAHSFTYPLGHFITARYWHNVDPDGLHFAISDTGWGKAVWGKLYGQWLCEACIFTYDFDRFDAQKILPMFAKYRITTFCAPPTMYRFFIKEDLRKYDLSSLQHANIAGEALNPEVYKQFAGLTGLSLMEGFGQTETTLVVANLIGMAPKPGSMGKPSPLYDVDIVDPDGNPVKDGETGEIVIRTSERVPFGLFREYYLDQAHTVEAWHDGCYHTGDTAWRDEDGYFWYVGRVDDVIKSSGYRIGPFEIESVIMELPYVLECAITAAPDEIRGQVVKATIVLTGDKQGSPDLVAEIQNYVKHRTAPYKYPRIVEFVKELPKTISGKIRRSELRQRSREESR